LLALRIMTKSGQSNLTIIFKKTNNPLKNYLMKLKITFFLFISMCFVANAQLLPREYLQRQTKPVFRPNHTLPPLQCNGYGSGTTYGNPGEPVRSFNNQLEMVNNWGYAFDFDGNLLNPDAFESNKAIIDNPTSDARKMIDLARSDPSKYKLSGVIAQYKQNGKVPLSPTECPDCYAKDAQGNIIKDASNIPVVNPLMSDESLARCGQKLAKMYDYIKTIAPFTNAVDYGEVGVFLPLFARQHWLKDPRVVAESGFAQGAGASNAWNIYYSQKWTRIQKGFWQYLPSKLTPEGYVNVYVNDGGESRGRFGDWVDYNTSFEHTKDLSKYANGQSYYSLLNNRFNIGLLGDNRPDMLSTFLYRRRWELSNGQPFGVEWTNGACSTAETEYDRWTGFLKCIYVGGNLSSIAGFFGDDWNLPFLDANGIPTRTATNTPNPNYKSLPQLYPTTFAENNPPFFIKQIMALSRVHAMFTWIEPFTRNSDLLVGNVSAAWGGSGLLAEFSNTANDKGARVMARKLRNENKWLVTAWAMTGEDREVEVTIPNLGTIKVNARKTGTIYHIDNTSGTPNFTILDSDGMGIVTDEVMMKNTLCYLYNGGCQTTCALPSEWTFASIGGVNGQSTCEQSGTFTLKAGGADIWTTADQFNFTYKKLKGDGTIIAKVNSIQNTSEYAKVGVMIRQDLTPGSANAACLMWPNRATFQYRTAANATAIGTNIINIPAPRWVKLQRVGNVFTAYHSADGNTWAQIGSSTTISMGVDVYIGMAATSHNTNTIGTSSISNISVSSDNCTSSGLTFASIGVVNGQSTCESNGTFTLRSSGADIWTTSDQFNYNYQTLNGDGTIVAKVNSIQNTSDYAKVGVMIRQDLTPGSANAACLMWQNRATSQFRTAANATATGTNIINILVPRWVKLQRVGNVFTASHSVNGNNWTQIGTSQTINMGANVYIGLAATSHNVNTIGTSSISNVRITKVNSSTNRESALGIEDIASSLSSEALSIFPNPNNGSFSVTFDNLEKDNYTLEVNNLLGQSVYKESLTNFSGNMSKELSLPNNEKGVYIITLVNSNNSKIVKKIVVN
jgi:Secretion system C-terminal sorting domain